MKEEQKHLIDSPVSMVSLDDYLAEYSYLRLRDKKWPTDNPADMHARVQALLTDIALKKTRMQELIEESRKEYIRKLVIHLRKAFLRRFRYPMGVACGTFVRTKWNDQFIYYFNGYPFAKEIQEFEVDSDAGRSNAHVGTRFEFISSDFLIELLPVKSFRIGCEAYAIGGMPVAQINPIVYDPTQIP